MQRPRIAYTSIIEIMPDERRTHFTASKGPTISGIAPAVQQREDLHPSKLPEASCLKMPIGSTPDLLTRRCISAVAASSYSAGSISLVTNCNQLGVGIVLKVLETILNP